MTRFKKIVETCLRISSRIDKRERQRSARARLEKLVTNKKKKKRKKKRKRKEPPLELPCFYRVAFVVRPPTPSSIAPDTGRLLIFDSVEREYERYSLPEMRSVGRLVGWLVGWLRKKPVSLETRRRSRGTDDTKSR